jgi:hypothetical protein
MAKLSIFIVTIILSATLVLASDDYLYENCGANKVCLGPTDDCVADKDCVTFGSAEIKSE